MPHGFSHHDYDFFSDGKYYSVYVENRDCRAVYYEGEFDKGYRYGEGIVVYDYNHESSHDNRGTAKEAHIPYTAAPCIFYPEWLFRDLQNVYRQ